MYFKIIFSLSVTCVLNAFQVNSQTIIAGSEIREGLPLPVSSNTGYQDNEYIRQQGLTKSAIYFNDETVIFPTSDGLIKIDKNMRVLWKADAIKNVNSLAKLGNNLLIISTDFKDAKQKDNASTVTAKLIDVTSGKLIKEKI